MRREEDATTTAGVWGPGMSPLLVVLQSESPRSASNAEVVGAWRGGSERIRSSRRRTPAADDRSRHRHRVRQRLRPTRAQAADRLRGDGGLERGKAGAVHTAAGLVASRIRRRDDDPARPPGPAPTLHCTTHVSQEPPRVRNRSAPCSQLLLLWSCSKVADHGGIARVTSCDGPGRGPSEVARCPRDRGHGGVEGRGGEDHHRGIPGGGAGGGKRSVTLVDSDPQGAPPTGSSTPATRSSSRST